MSETKFTEGPWVIDGQDIFGVNDSGDGRMFVGTWSTTKHNAHLIAAAPELYEALVLLSECEGPETRSFYDEDGVEGWEWTHPDGRTWQVLCGWEETPIHPVAEAALAKARGES